MTAAARNIAICANKLIIFLRDLCQSLALCIAKAFNFRVKDAALREDVHALGDLIGETLRDQGGEEFFELVEGDRLAAIRRREGDAQGAAESDNRARRADRPPAATDLTRAFSIWFMAVNTAEKAHRVRRRREYLERFAARRSPAESPIASRACSATACRSIRRCELIASMSIEPVFTAHPTESTRRTILRKQQHIAHDLLERTESRHRRGRNWTLCGRACGCEITSIWQTEEHPREGLTVVDEREHVLFYLIDILYRVVPLFYEEIEAALAHAYSVPVETLDVPNILRFGSWVGGDMDGNADVHGKTIRETLHRHQQLIVSTYFAECGQLAESLSQSANRVERERRACRAHRFLQRRYCRAPRRSRPRATIACRTVCSSARSASGSRRPTRAGPTPIRIPTSCWPTSALAADSLLENRGAPRRIFPGAPAHAPGAHFRISSGDAGRHSACAYPR